MAEKSQYPLTVNNHKFKSCTAITTAYTKKVSDNAESPKGVWHSVAIIKTKNVELNSDKLDFAFDIPFDNNLEADEGEITVYNLSDKTIRALKTGNSIVIEAGYKGDTGVIFDGEIKKVSTKYEGVDRVTTIKVIDQLKGMSTEVHLEGYTNSSEILHKLLQEIKDYPIVRFKPQFSKVHENGVTIDAPLAEAIRTYSEECGVNTWTNKGRIYCCQLHQADHAPAFTVSPETGLIGTPTWYENEQGSENSGYEFEMLLQHRITTGSKVELKSKQLALDDVINHSETGIYYVRSGTHSFNGTEAKTKVQTVWSVIAAG